MKILIEEYGKVVIYFLVGTVILGLIVGGIRLWYRDYYPELYQNSNTGVAIVVNEPVLCVENIEIESQETMSFIDYTAYASAFENGNIDEEIQVIVYGTEQVDITTQGIYQLVFEVTSSTGTSYSKRVPVLVY